MDENAAVFSRVAFVGVEGRSGRGVGSLGNGEGGTWVAAVLREAHLPRAGGVGSRLALGRLHGGFAELDYRYIELDAESLFLEYRGRFCFDWCVKLENPGVETKCQETRLLCRWRALMSWGCSPYHILG